MPLLEILHARYRLISYFLPTVLSTVALKCDRLAFVCCHVYVISMDCIVSNGACVLQQKLQLTAYTKSYMRNRLVPDPFQILRSFPKLLSELLSDVSLTIHPSSFFYRPDSQHIVHITPLRRRSSDYTMI